MGKPKTFIARQILKSYNQEGFSGSIIYGKRGNGKSTFSILTLYDVYHNGIDIPEEEAWDKVLTHCLFDLEEIIERLDYYMDKEKPAVGLILDDCGVYFSGYIYNERQKEHSILKGMMDTVRTGTSSLLMTAPSINDLIGYMKSKDDYRIKIIKTDENYQRKALVYEKSTLPSGSSRIYKRAETDFLCKLPDHIYERYKKKRTSYFRDLKEDLKSEIDFQLEDAKA